MIEEECCYEKEAADDRPAEKKDVPEPEKKIDLLVDDVLIRETDDEELVTEYCYLSEDTESVA